MTLEELDILAKDRYYADDLTGAMACYAQAFVEFPEIALAYNNYGNILRERGYPKQAIKFLENAIELDPADKIAPLNLAIAYLTMGDLKNGWQLFESRWKFRGHDHYLDLYEKPRWWGEDITGKTLLVTCEEGDGDNLQFIRYVNVLEDIGINVIIQTEPNLKTIFEASFTHQVITNKDTPPAHDYWIPVLSLPGALGITYEHFILVNNYLTPTKEMVKSWKKILGKKTKPRIVFSWRGHTKTYPRDKMLEFVKNHPHYDWISIQTNLTEEDGIALHEAGAVHYFEHIKEWHDTAGLFANVDLVISVDTGVMHLAGAMGVNGIILLDRHKTCWRWLLNREDTPWYPSIRLLRQIEMRNYNEQLARLEKLLP